MAMVLTSPYTASAATGQKGLKGTGSDVTRFGNDLLSLLGGVGLVALAVLGFVVAALLVLVILLRVFPPLADLVRWLSKQEWGTPDFYSSDWWLWWKALQRWFVRAFVWLAGLQVGVQNFTASQDQQPLAAALNANVRAVLGSGGVTPATGAATGASGTAQPVTTPLGSVGLLENIADALQDVPQGKYIGALLRLIGKLVPRDVFTVSGDVLPAGARGPGLVLSLRDPTGDVKATETLWASDYDPQPSVGGTAPTPTSTADAQQRLGVAAGCWVMYATLEQRGNLKVCRDLGTTQWRSYALFRAGLEAQRTGKLDAALSLYVRAVDEDGTNYPALVNLALLERTSPERLNAAAARLELVKERVAENDESRRVLRDTLWYQASYSLAVVQLQLDRPKPAYKNALKLGYELEQTLVALHQKGKLRPRERALQALLHQMEGPAMLVLADAAYRFSP
jgi:hypothetical protein